MLPVIPDSVNKWLVGPNGLTAMQQFPLNLVAFLDEEKQKKIVRYINSNYAWPQIQERRPFESMWDAILKMYRIKLDKVDSNLEEGTQAGRTAQETQGESLRVADSVVHDAIERLTDITHFVSFKEDIPIQYNIPRYYDTRLQDSFYAPLRDKLKGANALLQWNFDNEEVYRKHQIAARHFYTYGIAFANSEFMFETRDMQRYSSQQGTYISRPEITKIGTSFDPISVRRLFLNFRVSAYDMENQPCPFWYDVVPRFAMLQNQYSPEVNPFGFLNLEKLRDLSTQQWLFTEEETRSERAALEDLLSKSGTNSSDSATQGSKSIYNIISPEHSVEAKWKFWPMLPLDPNTLEFETYQDGTPIPFQRYRVEIFGANTWGSQILLTIQRNFYPRDMLPLYGTTHMPDLDSGLYCPSLGYLLWNHYKEICTCTNQYIANKDWINDPPAFIQVSSPGYKENLTKKGAKIPVNGPNDFGWRQPYDATGSTVQMLSMLRESAQTTSKSVDAIMGKAMGSRTSATEAENAFQAAMSSVTTPINLFNYDMMGGFAERVWNYTGTWFDKDLLKEITGQMGFCLTPEDMWLRIGLKWDVGSSFVESIVRQQNIRYLLESSINDPFINRPKLYRELLREWRFPNAEELVDDGGFEREVAFATLQVIKTFEGDPLSPPPPVNPDQNHAIALKVISGFLEDSDSYWMKNYGQNAPYLVQRAQLHMQFQLMQQQLMEAQMRAQQLSDAADRQLEKPEEPPEKGGGGDVAQKQGSRMS